MRLIDADNVPVMFDAEFKETKKLILEGETHLDNLAEGFAEAIHVIRAMQTIDAVPVVHGRWEHGYYCYEPATQCSVCKVCLAKGHRAEKQFTYCPNCGAKMDGGPT